MSKELDNLINVTPESFPVEGDDTQSGNEPDEVIDEGNTPEGGDEGDEPKGRTLDNVRGELVRKLEDGLGTITEQVNAIAARVEAVLAQQSSPKPTGETNGNVLDQYSVDQLNGALKSTEFDDATKQMIRDYLPGRIARDESRRVLDGINTNQAKAKAHQDAVNSYPELRVRTSKIYLETLRIINSRGGDEYTAKNPTALLDAANEAARILGIQPRGKTRMTVRGSQRSDVDPGSRDSNRPTKSKKEEVSPLSEAERERVERKLAPLLGKDKDGKPKKFTKTFIEERNKHYGKLFRGGR